MSLFKIIIHKPNSLFYEFETNWIEANSLRHCKSRVRKLLKFKSRFTSSKKFFMIEKNQIESILIKDEIYKENNIPYTKTHDILVFP